MDKLGLLFFNNFRLTLMQRLSGSLLNIPPTRVSIVGIKNITFTDPHRCYNLIMFGILIRLYYDVTRVQKLLGTLPINTQLFDIWQLIFCVFFFLLTNFDSFLFFWAIRWYFCFIINSRRHRHGLRLLLDLNSFDLSQIISGPIAF